MTPWICKKCGGTLHPEKGQTAVTCDSCGTTQEQKAEKNGRKRKRIFVLTICLVFLLAIGSMLFSVIQNAILFEVVDGVTYINKGDHFALYEVDPTIGGLVTIPGEINGKPMPVIPKAAFKDCHNIVALEIQSGVTTIEDEAFANCTQLGHIFFMEDYTLLEIGDAAFSGCDALEEFYLPDTVTTVGERAFANCTAMTATMLPASATAIGKDAYLGCTALTHVYISPGRATSDLPDFIDCQRLTKVTFLDSDAPINSNTVAVFPNVSTIVFPADLEKIEAYAFQNLKTLTRVGFTEGSRLTEIGERAFYGCTALLSISEDIDGGDVRALPGSLTAIGKEAFAYTGLQFIELPDSLIHIGEGAFYECRSLARVNFAQGAALTTIADSAFANCSGLTLINVPKNVKTIGNNAFCGCTFLFTLTLEEDSLLTSIGDGAFKDCINLTAFRIPAHVTSIGNEAFLNCEKLEAIAFTSGSALKEIGTAAFKNCHSLRAISIPAGVTALRDEIFYNCENLTVVTLEKGSALKEIGASAFRNCSSLLSLSLPARVTAIGDSAFLNCEKLTSIAFESGSALKEIGSNAFKNCFSLASVTVPAGVTTIGDGAFQSCRALTTVLFEAGTQLQTIGAYAFHGCSALTAIALPESLTAIGEQSFVGCHALTAVRIPTGVTSIGGYAFHNCTNLTKVAIGENVVSLGLGYLFERPKLKEVIFLDGVTSLSDKSLFLDCSAIVAFVLPQSLTEIGKNMFDLCAKLTTIYYGGTAAEWAQISVSSGNYILESATRYDYSAEEPTTEGNYWHYDANGEITIW